MHAAPFATRSTIAAIGVFLFGALLGFLPADRLLIHIFDLADQHLLPGFARLLYSGFGCF